MINDDDELAHGENARLKHDIFDSSVRTNIFGVLVFDRLPVDRQTACQKNYRQPTNGSKLACDDA